MQFDLKNGKMMGGAAAALVAFATPAVAVAPGIGVGDSQFAIGVTGFVPVICRASVEADMVTPQATGEMRTASLGTLREFCNSPTGYRVVADYSPSLESGRLVVDGQEIALTSAGSVVVSKSDQAAIASHTVELEAPEGVTQGSLSFRIEPR